jgi:hypothetical protein
MTNRISSTSIFTLGLWLLFATTAALSLMLMYMAGCIGDPKGGSYGDPVRALELEGYALFPLIICATLAGIGISRRSRTNNRGAVGTAFALLWLILLWLAGIHMETWAVQTCFVQQ